MNGGDTPPGRFTVLGAVAMIGPSGQERTYVGRLRSLLGALLVNLGQVVSIEVLADLMWEGDPPGAPRAQVRAAVHTLRADLTRLGIAAEIVTRAPGYRLEADPRQVDGECFRHGAEQARRMAAEANRAGAIACYRSALRVWRGRPLDGVSGALRDQVEGLESLRLEVLQECLELELEVNGERRVLGELRAEVGANPLHEGLRGLLMRTLSTMGRQAEALDVYRAGRDVLRRELGVAPSALLRQLEAAILTGALTQPQAADAPVPPRQLPSVGGELAGREDVIADLVETVTGTPRAVLNITGMPGVGKSSVGVAVAHRSAPAFPGGQLYVDLTEEHGVTLTTAQVVMAFLRALGVGGASVPAAQADRERLYQRLLVGRRVLVVFDNATQASQIEPLLPEAPGCAVIIISRCRLALSAPARHVRLDELDQDAGLAMLTDLVGTARVRAEPGAAADLVSAVGGLPLALRVVGAKLAARPHLTLRAMADQLADGSVRIDRLTHGTMMVRRSLELAHAELDGNAAALLEKLALVDAHTVPAWVAHAVLGLPDDTVTDLAGRLVSARLLDVTPEEDRFQFHLLVRLFARQRRDVGRATEAVVMRRVLGGWLYLADQAHRALHGGDFVTLRGTAARWEPPRRFVTAVIENPLVWLENERPQLLAAVGQAARLGLSGLCWELAVALVTLFEARGHLDDWRHTHDIALRTALAHRDERGVAVVRCSLSSLLLTQHKPGPAKAQLASALESFERVGDVRGVALACRNLAMLDRLHDPIGARVHGERALDCYREAGDPVGQAVALGQLAQLELDAGHLDRAHGYLTSALHACRQARSARVEAQTKFKQGKVLAAEGELDAAAETMSEVLGLVRASGDETGESLALRELGVLHLRRGHWDEAAADLNQAAELCRRTCDDVGAARVWLDLARLEEQQGHADVASTLSRRARDVFARYDLPQPDVLTPQGSA